MAIHNFLSFLPSCLALPPRPFNFSSSTTTTTITTINMDLISSTRLTSQTRPRTFSVQSINTNFSAAVGEDLPVDYANWFGKADPENRRRAGVLLHPTSFPGPYGIGDLGDHAFRFLDWLHEAGCSLWQVLPLVPPGRKANEEGSPYSGQDANCGNILLISLEELVKDGLLMKEELPEPIDEDCVKFSTVADIKDPLIAKFHSLSVTVSLPNVILVLLLVVMIRISYIVITASDLVTLGRLVGVSMVDLLLEDEVVVQALQVAVLAILVLIILQWSSLLLQALSLWPYQPLILSCFAT
ncbi:disproportionating enzyme [Actinidia rufa]|uniref:4-alpha-glucanotransferase n=1 Tax=Actinidia rufa TaxID=165716 RepID=A0A7J0EL61_9ERIC|nr:disproportionating enzyme [Actinidia rufa]